MLSIPEATNQKIINMHYFLQFLMWLLVSNNRIYNGLKLRRISQCLIQCVASLFCRIITFTDVKSVWLKGKKKLYSYISLLFTFSVPLFLLFSQYHRLNCIHPKSISSPGASIEVLTPNNFHVTVFGKRVFKKVMKVKWDH